MDDTLFIFCDLSSNDNILKRISNPLNISTDSDDGGGENKLKNTNIKQYIFNANMFLNA